MTGKTILVVEDEPTIALILVDYLKRAGFTPLHIENGAEALDYMRRLSPALVLLDIMLPGLDGISLCREVRKFSNVPIIMVTARVEEVDRLIGLDVGADDYICKPFSPREVIARIGAVLRRTVPQEKTSANSLFEVAEESQRITVAGKRLDLTPTEFRLLKLLISRPGRIFSRAQILELAYPDSEDVSDRIVDSHVKNIRKKLDGLLPGTEVLHSVYGIGYRFEIQ